MYSLPTYGDKCCNMSVINQLANVLNELTNVFKDMKTVYARGMITNNDGTRSFAHESFKILNILKDTHLELAQCKNISDDILKGMVSKILSTFEYTNPRERLNDNYFVSYSVNNFYRNVPISYIGCLGDITQMGSFSDHIIYPISDIQKIVSIVTNSVYTSMFNADTPRNVLFLQLATYVKTTYFNKHLCSLETIEMVTNNQSKLDNKINSVIKHIQENSQFNKSDAQSNNDFTQSEFVKMLQDVNACLQEQSKTIKELQHMNNDLQKQINEISKPQMSKKEVSDIVYDILSKEEILVEEVSMEKINEQFGNELLIPMEEFNKLNTKHKDVNQNDNQIGQQL